MSKNESDGSVSAIDDWQHRYQRQRIDSLSPTQRDTTRWDGDLTVAIGGPGTGKSTTIGLLLDRLTDEGISADDCTVLSLNRTIAAETRSTLQTELGSRGHEVDVHTAHAKAREVLTQTPAAKRSTPLESDIATEVDEQLALQAALRRTQDQATVSEGDITSALQAIGGLKKTGTTPEDLSAELGDIAAYQTIETILDDISSAATTLLTPDAATPDTLSGVRSKLLMVSDMIEDAIPSGTINSENDPLLLSTAWTYLDLLRKTTASAVEWLAANEGVICDDHPELAALPAYLLGAPHPDRAFSGDLEGWPISHHPHREATLFLEEVQRAAELLPTWHAYEEELAGRELVDFESMLLDAVKILREDPATRARVQAERVIVDEGQDLSPLMLSFARHLTDAECIIFGDTCQTINEWAGANRYSIGDLIAEGANIRKLGVDYRKAPAIERFCDNVRMTIDDEEPLNLDSYRSKRLPDGTGPPWSDTPIRWVSQADDGTAAYSAVLDALEEDSVPDWQVPENASIATLARRGKTVSNMVDIVAPDTQTDTASPSIPALFQLLRFLSKVAGFGCETEYVGQYADDDSDHDEPVDRLPELLTVWYDIPHNVTAVLKRDDCNPWIALVRLVEYEQDEALEQPVYRSAFADAYRDLIDLATRSQRNTLTQLIDDLRDRFDLPTQPAIDSTALEALGTAVDEVETSEMALSMRPDRGALAQLETRWQAIEKGDRTGSHTVSTIHNFKGDEADIVLLPNLTSSPWSVFDTSPRPFDRQRAVNSLSRVRHGLAFDTSPITTSMVQRKRHNQRRVAYTAISRARDLLVLFGAPADEPRQRSTVIEPDECLPKEVHRVEAAHSLDIWTELQAALPEDGAEHWSRETLGLDRDGGGD